MSRDDGPTPTEALVAIVADPDGAIEWKFVTVVFADIKGSTEAAAIADPEDWFAALERFHAVASGSIHTFGGVVASYAGDGVMAVFGAPIAHEHHGDQACLAALQLVEQMEALADELAPALGARLAMRVGINSGHVVVGRIGEGPRIDYTAQGVPVHLAARMEQIAEAGQIFVAPSTVALIGDRFELTPVGEQAVKGVADPVLVHRLGPRRDLGTSGALVRPTARSSIVGRSRELDVLREALADVRAGGTRVVTITAPAGYGKSRLTGAFLGESLDAGCDVVTVVGDTVRIPGPMWGVAELVLALSGARHRVGEDALAAVLSQPGDTTASWEAPLRLLFTHTGPASSLPPDVARRQIEAVLRALVERRARVGPRPVVMAIDDFHALDGASRSTVTAVLDDLDELADVPLLVVLTRRPSTNPAERLPRSAIAIELAALTLAETEQLVCQRIRTRAEGIHLAQLLHERSGGNPLFIEEIVRSLIETGRLVGRVGGVLQLSGPVVGLALPERVQTVIAARIDRLDRGQRDVLLAAAVIGVEFDDGTLRAATDLDGADISAALEALIAADLVRALAGGRYAFRHRTIHDVAYDSQLRERRRRSHAAVAEALGTQPGSEQHLALVADHHDRAGNAAAAADWYGRAATLAARTDPVESTRLWQRVRALVDATDPASAGRAVACRAEALMQGSRAGLASTEVLTILDEIRSIASEPGQAAMLAVGLLRGWYALSAAGLSSQARAIAAEAVTVADITTIALISVGARLARLAGYNAAGSVADGLAGCDEAEAILIEAGLDTPESALRGQLDFTRGSLLVRAGRSDEAIGLLQGAVALADVVADPMWRVVGRSGLVVALAERGDVIGARRVADAALAIAREVSGDGELCMALLALGRAALVGGDPVTAISAMTEAHDRARAAPALTSEEMLMALLSDAYLLTGDPVRAEALAREAVATARQRGNDNFELMAALSLIRALLALSTIDDPPTRPEDRKSSLNVLNTLIDLRDVDHARETRSLLARCRQIVDSNQMLMCRNDLEALETEAQRLLGVIA